MTTGSIVFLYIFIFFMFISLPMSQFAYVFCGSVGLFAIHLKFLKTHCYEVAIDLWNKNDKNEVINIGWVRLSSW